MSDLYALALNATRELTPAELHGAVCGLAVCCSEEFPLDSLLGLVGVDAVTDEFSVESFVNASMESMVAEDMGFAPLWPDDSLEIGARLEGLADWCAAFLAGLAAGLGHRNVSSLDELPNEAQEIISDIRAVADVDLTVPEDLPRSGEDAEEDLMQLQEFVKVAVLLIMSLLSGDAEDVGGDAEDVGTGAEDVGGDS